MKNDYTVVMDTPVYVQNVLSGLNASEVSVCITFPPQHCLCRTPHWFQKCAFNMFLTVYSLLVIYNSLPMPLLR